MPQNVIILENPGGRKEEGKTWEREQKMSTNFNEHIY
jgi:hypothetical protein